MTNQPSQASTLQAALAEARFLNYARMGLAVVALIVGPAVGIASGVVAAAVLVFAAAALLASVLFIWSSLRTLSGDAALSWDSALPDNTTAEGNLLAKKSLLLRSLRDLDQEHELGRLSEADYAVARDQYRAELRQVLEATDKALASHRDAAELLINEYKLSKSQSAYRSKPVSQATVACPSCTALNENDARFCKSCAFELKGAP